MPRSGGASARPRCIGAGSGLSAHVRILAAYLVGDGRGRPAFLGAAAIGLWASVLQLTEHLLDLPFTLAQLIPSMFLGFDSSSFESTGSSLDSGSFTTDTSGGILSEANVPSALRHLPDPTTIGVLSLLIGLGYLLPALG